MKNLDIFIEDLFKRHKALNEYLPNISEAHLLTDSVIQLLFPNNKCDSLNQFAVRFKQSALMLEKLLVSISDKLADTPSHHTTIFFDAIPGLYQLLQKDAEAIYNFDPAVSNLQEVICAYPGFYAIAVYRLANQLSRQNVPLLPRIMAEYAHSRTGIDINPGATIGESFFIDHGTGVVIGETTHIGNNVKIYQGVTLGALNVKKAMASKKRHPTIQDNVIIYAGSTVLGGETIIGHDSVLGGNVWVTESIPPNSVVYQTSNVKIRDGNIKEDYIDFSI